MKQELQTVRASEVSSGGALAGRDFAALFALARPEPQTIRSVRNRLGLGDREYRDLVDALQKRYLVDVVSLLEKSDVKETLVLSEEGEWALLGRLEGMCELPEAP